MWNYDAELVWNDDNLATAYVTDLYGDIFKGWDTGADNTAEQQTGIPFMLSTIRLLVVAINVGIIRIYVI